jgi:hypothetical protein
MLGYKFGAFVLELNVMGSSQSYGNFSGHHLFFILLATVSGDFSFVNAYCVLTGIGFQCINFDIWCDGIVSWVK